MASCYFDRMLCQRQANCPPLSYPNCIPKLYTMLIVYIHNVVGTSAHPSSIHPSIFVFLYLLLSSIYIYNGLFSPMLYKFGSCYAHYFKSLAICHGHTSRSVHLDLIHSSVCLYCLIY